MRASEVINEVKKLIKDYGDIEVLDDEGFLINTIKMEQEAGNKYVVVANLEE